MESLMSAGFTAAQAAHAVNHIAATDSYMERWTYTIVILGADGDDARGWLSAHNLWNKP